MLMSRFFGELSPPTSPCALVLSSFSSLHGKDPWLPLLSLSLSLSLSLRLVVLSPVRGGPSVDPPCGSWHAAGPRFSLRHSNSVTSSDTAALEAIGHLRTRHTKPASTGGICCYINFSRNAFISNKIYLINSWLNQYPWLHPLIWTWTFIARTKNHQSQGSIIRIRIISILFRIVSTIARFSARMSYGITKYCNTKLKHKKLFHSTRKP